jgi:putative tryptophan/tyrosine transport system substrate-binding protein
MDHLPPAGESRSLGTPTAIGCRFQQWRSLMRRREFIAGLGGVVAWPLAAQAQQSKVPVIGFLHPGTPNSFTSDLAAGFAQGLKELGIVDGKNVAIEYRWANGQPEQLRALATDLVGRQASVILAGGGVPSAVAAKAATLTIPIVVVFAGNPVSLGLVASLNSPGGNVTGVTFLSNELMSKRLGLLLAMVPAARTVGYLAEDPRMYTEGRAILEMKNDMLAAARAIDRPLVIAEIGNDHGFDAAFETFAGHHVDGLIVQPSPLFGSYRDQIVLLAARHRIPAIYIDRRFTAAGGLMAYSADIVAAWREGGEYVGKLLKGAKPADMPFVQATRYELIINLKTAKALGLEVPETLLAIADELIR